MNLSEVPVAMVLDLEAAGVMPGIISGMAGRMFEFSGGCICHRYDIDMFPNWGLADIQLAQISNLQGQ